MDSYDNDWVLMLDDDLFPVEKENVDRVESQSDRAKSR